MDAVSYSHADKQKQRIEKFIEQPDSTSGVVTVPKVIGAGENITVPAGRVAVLPNVQVDGTLNVEGEVFIPSGATFGDVESQIASKVSLNEDETIAGVKTFSSSPIVPTPTSGTQAVNKNYADLKVALADFIGANQSKSANGYQKLPGGLIIQWGLVSGSGLGNTQSFPIAFPNAALVITSTGIGTNSTLAARIISKSSFQLFNGNGDTSNWIAVGY